ncbi:hypothetical protein [Ascidiaceihabitans sp.]|uniref:hypothetical protein n=1 Tax=Ascidiaceihabitans sp. TaxID=1872644 RepID=UPI003297BAD4
MKVIENTAEQLVLSQTPWVLGILMSIVSLGAIGTVLVLLYHRQWLLGAFIAGVSVLVLPIAVLLVVQRTQIVVTPVNVSIQSQNLARVFKTDVATQTIKRASVERFRQEGDVITTFRPVLVTPDGDVPLRKGFQNGNGAQDIADIINTWLDAHRGG